MNIDDLKMSLSEHRKHCKANKRKCPYEKKAVKAYLDLVKHESERDRPDDLSKAVQSPMQFRKRMNRLVNRLLADGWSEGLADEIMRAVDDVSDGKAKPVRMPGDTMTSDKTGSFPNWFLAAYHMATATDTGQPDPERIVSKKVNEVVEKVLRGFNAWTDNISKSCSKKYGKPFGSGSESVVYMKDKNHVAKSSTLAHTKNVIVAMERLMLSNLIFPKTAHKVVAMGAPNDVYYNGSGRSYVPIGFELEQQMFRFRYFRTEEAVDKALNEEGFVRVYGDDFQSKDGELKIIDCKRVNVPHDSKGRVLMIDAGVTLTNTATGIWEKPLDGLKMMQKKEKE